MPIKHIALSQRVATRHQQTDVHESITKQDRNNINNRTNNACLHSFAGVFEIDPRVCPIHREDLVMKMVLKTFFIFRIDHAENLLSVWT